MAVPSDFLEMMLQTVTVAAQTGLDNYGKPSFSASPTSYRCRIIWQERIRRDNQGRELVEAGRAILTQAAASVLPTHKLTLPDGSTPKIVSVATIQDENGDHHSVISFGQ
jgi:hypothetical protein